MYTNGSANFSPIVRGREIMAARAAARAAENAAYLEAATSTGAVIGYKNYNNVKNYADLLVASEDMVETTKGPLQQPRVQRIFIKNDNEEAKKRLMDQAREMGKRFGYYVIFSDQELQL